MRTAVHLHIRRYKQGFPACLSVKDTAKPVHYSAWVALRGAKFTVAPAGLRRFRETGQKNVHAFVRGEKVTEARSVFPDAEWERHGWQQVRYNPAQMDTFQLLDGTPVHSAEYVFCVGSKIWALGPST